MQAQLENTKKLWSKYYILIILFSLLSSTANHMLMIGVPLYAMHLGGNKSIAGLMMGMFMIVAILFRPLFGKLLDDRGRRMVLVTGITISALMCFLYTFAFSVGILLLLRALNGIGFSAMTNASGTIVSDVVPSSRLAEGVGYYGMSNTLATAVGPALTLFIIQYHSYKVLFVAASAISVLAVICSLFISYEKGRKKKGMTGEEQRENTSAGIDLKKKIADAIFEKTALPTALVIIFAAATLGSIMTFIPTYAATRGIENISIYFTVYALTLLFTRLFAGRLADRCGSSVVIIPGILIIAVSFVILSFASSIPGFLVSAVLYGLGYGSAQPALNAIMIRLCPADRRGAGNSTFFTAMDIGSGGGAVIWGVIAQNVGFLWVYLSCAASALIALAAYVSVLQRQLEAVNARKSPTGR